jgi:hypothetical protein
LGVDFFKHFCFQLSLRGRRGRRPETGSAATKQSHVSWLLEIATPLRGSQ